MALSTSRSTSTKKDLLSMVAVVFSRFRFSTGVLVAACALILPSNGADSATPESQTSGIRTAMKSNWLYAWRFRQIENATQRVSRETTGTIVFIGDSITQGHPLKQLNGLPIINQGIGGDHLDTSVGLGIIHRLDLVEAARPAHIFIMAGMADLALSREPLDQVEMEYRRVVSEIQRRLPATTLHLVSLLPTSGSYGMHSWKAEEVNRQILLISREVNARYLDLHSHFVDKNGKLRSEFTIDGAHLLPAGYRLWTELLHKHMAPGSTHLRK
jgi:lysophospholipase L1-like esterase